MATGYLEDTSYAKVELRVTAPGYGVNTSGPGLLAIALYALAP